MKLNVYLQYSLVSCCIIEMYKGLFALLDIFLQKVHLGYGTSEDYFFICVTVCWQTTHVEYACLFPRKNV